MLSDADGDVVKSLGLVEDMGFGLGIRSQRFALVVKDGVVRRLPSLSPRNSIPYHGKLPPKASTCVSQVQHVAVDPGTAQLETTSAEVSHVR